MIDLVVVPRLFGPGRRRHRIEPPATPGDLVGTRLEAGDWHFVADGRGIGRDDAIPQDCTELVAVRAPEGAIGGIIFSAIVSSLIGFGVSFIVNLLFGQDVEAESNDGSSPTYGWTGIRNTTTQGTPIPRVYGRHRVGGQVLNAYRRTSVSGTREFLFMVIGLSSGPVQAINRIATHRDDLSSQAPDNEHGAALSINGLPSTTYEGVQVWYRMGTTDQPVYPNSLSRAVQSVEVDDLVELSSLDGDWQVFVGQGTMTGAYLNFRFPRGLYDARDGGVDEIEVQIEVQYLDAGTWKNVPDYSGSGGPIVSAGRFIVRGSTTQPFSRTLFAEDLFGGSAQTTQFRYRRVAPAIDDDRVGDDVRLADVGQIVDDEDRSYPGIATIGLQIRATDRLRGGLPNVTCEVEGVHVPVISLGKSSDLDEPAVVYQYSRNPAWIALDILLDRKNGLGNDVSLADIDADSWLRWAQWCEETVAYREASLDPLFVTTNTESVSQGDASVVIDDATDAAEFQAGDFVEVENEGINRIAEVTDLGAGRTQLDLMLSIRKAYPDNFAFKKVSVEYTVSEPRALCDIVFDSENTAWDALRTVMRTGRAVPVKFGNRIKARYEDLGLPTQHISDTSMEAGSFEIDYIGKSERVDAVEVQYLDRGQGYDQAVERAGTTLDVLDKEPVTRAVQGYGITRRGHARREAFYQLLMNRRIWKKCRFQMQVDGITFEPGDVFSIGSRLADWSTLSSRATGTVGSFRLDHPLELEAGVEYRALIRRPDELAERAVQVLDVGITSSAGSYAAGDTITTDGGDQVLSQADVTIGTEARVRTLWRALNVTIDRDLKVSVEAAQYDPSIYELPGWSFGDPVIPDPGECVSPGELFVPLTDLLSSVGSCPAGLAATCEAADRVCLGRTPGITVAITGAGAGCTELISATEAGLIIAIDDGCAGDSITVEVTVTRQWVCCPEDCTDPDECFCAGPAETVEATETFEFDICT